MRFKLFFGSFFSREKGTKNVPPEYRRDASFNGFDRDYLWSTLYICLMSSSTLLE